MNNEHCTREDLRVEVIGNASVDDLGQPILDSHAERTTGVHDHPKPYFCVGPCDELHSAGSDFATWKEALDHLKEAA